MGPSRCRGVAVAGWRRERVVLVLAGGIVAWVLIEIAFAFHGFPALPCYPVHVRTGGRGRSARGDRRWVGAQRAGLAEAGRSRVVGTVVVAVLPGTLVPGAIARLRAERTDLRLQRGRTNEIRLLQTTIDELGGHRKIRACREPVTVVEFASVLAWDTRLNVGSVGYLPGFEKRRRYPTYRSCRYRPVGGRCGRGTHPVPDSAAARSFAPRT